MPISIETDAAPVFLIMMGATKGISIDSAVKTTSPIAAITSATFRGFTILAHSLELGNEQ